MRLLIGLPLVILAGCSNAPATKGDVDEAVARLEHQANRYGNTTALTDRIATLEREVQYLREENAKRAAAISQNANLDLRQSEYVNATFEGLYDNFETTRRAINQQRSADGWPIIPTNDKEREKKNP